MTPAAFMQSHTSLDAFFRAMKKLCEYFKSHFFPMKQLPWLPRPRGAE
jgi:hypothetical protein